MWLPYVVGRLCGWGSRGSFVGSGFGWGPQLWSGCVEALLCLGPSFVQDQCRICIGPHRKAVPFVCPPRHERSAVTQYLPVYFTIFFL